MRDVKVPKENISDRRAKVKGCAYGTRFWSNHLRRVLHRRGEDLPGTRGQTREYAKANSIKTLGNFHLVKKKSRGSAADAYAMER